MHPDSRYETVPALDNAGAGPWTHDPVEPADGPGLLASRAFWIGGLLSLLLWGTATALAITWW
jgi:hypothetical protein